MRIRIIITSCLFAACLLLLSCGFGSGGEDLPVEKVTQADLDKAQQKANSSRAEAEKARTKADKAKERADADQKAVDKAEGAEKRTAAQTASESRSTTQRLEKEAVDLEDQAATANSSYASMRQKLEKQGNTRGDDGSSGDGGGEGQSFIGAAWPFLIPTLKALGVAAALCLLAYTVMLLAGLRKTSSELLALVTDMRQRQRELPKQLNAGLTALTNELNARLANVQSELTNLSLLKHPGQRQLTDDVRRAGLPAMPYNAELPARPPEPDPFPASADEYLRRMSGRATVVKSDFTNGILIKDPEGQAELVLIHDENVADDLQPLFVVPRVTQFQTKQDFYNYYEKYYECQRPSSGAVWIIDPAVVEKVAGGWQLREKGRLEVR